MTGAGVDRLDRAKLTALGIPVANVAGGSNAAVAEYAVTNAALLLRRFAWAGSEIRRGHYAEFRARLLSDNVGGLEGLTVGIVGFGTIGVAVARAFHAARLPYRLFRSSARRSARRRGASRRRKCRSPMSSPAPMS